MNCHAARALLDLHAEGRLIARQADGVAAHVKTCGACADELSALRPAKAPATPMPAALKEKLRAALTAAASDLPPLILPKDPTGGSGPSTARDVLIALAAVLPFAPLAGASAVEAATVLGTLAAAGALLLHGLRRGRWTFTPGEGAAVLTAAAISTWFLARGVLGPSYELPAALCRAAWPALFIASAVALGGAEESASLRRALAWTAWAFPAQMLVTRAFPADAAISAAAIALGAAAGLRALSMTPAKAWALAVPLPPSPRRGLSLAFAAGMAAVALVPAVWVADDYKLASAKNLAGLESGREAAIAKLDTIRPSSPSWPEARVTAGDLALKGDDAAGALRRYLDVETVAPDYPGLAYREGLACGHFGNWPRALAYHLRARAQQPLFVANLEQLSAAAKSVGDFKLARAVALTVISLEPNDPVHGMALADIAAREKKAGDRSGDRHARRPQSKKKSSL